ncbi:2-dehydropantoate 2-reductase [Shewanella sedimentimangrovi]|uniref:2-dehydropantoate 2-reductase n=1 Tax=Shewanella sedimentimangrovi TaxID=2814293 RepID=A0ABX7R5I4_9GAMM|nr:2-dehydropantoate 2-reductase [Shewanella sedimentimangrovi]
MAAQRSWSSNLADIAILGPGAIGQLLAHQLGGDKLLPDQLLLIGRETQPQCHLQLQCADKQHSLKLPMLALSDVTPDALKGLRLLIVTLKAYQVEEAVDSLLDKLPHNCQLLLLHNGMGPHKALESKLGGRGLLLGTTSQGALRLGPFEVRQTGTGLTQYGHFCGPELDNDLRQRLLTVPGSEWCDDIETALWHKLAVNAAINPLTALERVNNGVLAEPRFTATISAIVDELLLVAGAEGIRLDRKVLLERIYKVIELTAANFSSMYQDVTQGRRSEIDAINGFLLTLAERHGLTLPVNQELVNRINALSPAAAPTPR